MAPQRTHCQVALPGADPPLPKDEVIGRRNGKVARCSSQSTPVRPAQEAIGCAAAWRLKRRNVALAGEALNFRWLGLAMMIGVSSMLVVIALAARAEIIGLTILVAASAALYFPQTRNARITR